MIVDDGVVIGFNIVGSLNPDTGDQIKVTPSPEPSNCTESPKSTVKSGPASAVAPDTVISTELVKIQPCSLVTVTE